MNDQLQLFFVERFKGKVLFDVPMSAHTTFAVGGPADVMAFPQDEADLRELLKFASARRFPVFILGGGANLLVREGGIRGIVVNMGAGLKEAVFQEGSSGAMKVVAGAGLALSELSRRAAREGLTGLEFACGIPGTVGGAVVMNAGAYGFEMGKLVESVEALDMKGKKLVLTGTELGFGYRSSNVPPHCVVVRANLSLERGDAAAIEEKMKEARERRKVSAPIIEPNAGSIFKNPPENSAGRLIEAAGFKGRSIGAARVSELHANYIVNAGGATARDVLALMAQIRDAVFSASGIVLEPEIRVVGEDAA